MRCSPTQSLIKEFHKEWCKASSSAGALGRLISLTRGPFPPFQRKHFSLSNTEHYTPFFSQGAEPVIVCNEQCKGCSFSFLSLALAVFLYLVSHFSSSAAAAISPTIHHLLPPPQSVICESCLSGLHFFKGAHLVTAQGNQSVDKLYITNVHSWSHFNETQLESTVNLFAPNSETSQ